MAAVGFVTYLTAAQLKSYNMRDISSTIKDISGNRNWISFERKVERDNDPRDKSSDIGYRASESPGYQRREEHVS